MEKKDIRTSIKEFYEKYSKYYSLIVGIPSILGALWQGVELFSINPAFIRFFSISQLISDGILIFSVIISFVIILLLVKLMLKKIGIFEPLKLDNENISENRKLLLSLIQIGLGILLIYTHFFHLNILEDINFSTSLLIFFVVSMTIPLILLGLLNLIITISVMISKKKAKETIIRISDNFSKQNGFLFNIVTLISVLLLPVILGICIIVPFKFRDEIINSDKIHNFSKIECVIKKEIGDNYEHKIRYFNDKFMFIEYKKGNNKESKIIIYETNDMLFKKNCK